MATPKKPRKLLETEPEGELFLLGLTLAVEACARLAKLPPHDCEDEAEEAGEECSCCACEVRSDAAGQEYTLHNFRCLVENTMYAPRARSLARRILAEMGMDARLSDDQDPKDERDALVLEACGRLAPAAPEDAPEPVLVPANA
jgi:hypothetical protein